MGVRCRRLCYVQKRARLPARLHGRLGPLDVDLPAAADEIAVVDVYAAPRRSKSSENVTNVKGSSPGFAGQATAV